MEQRRKVIVHIAASADGYVSRPDGDIEWLTRRPTPRDFYGMGEFLRTVDAKLVGRRTFEASLRLGAAFDPASPAYVFSRQPPPPTLPAGVEFVNEPVGPFVERLRKTPGRSIWLVGGANLIASCLDAGVIDEFIVSVVPVFIGDGKRLVAPRRRDVPLRLHSSRSFPDGVVELHYVVEAPSPS